MATLATLAKRIKDNFDLDNYKGAKKALLNSPKLQNLSVELSKAPQRATLQNAIKYGNEFSFGLGGAAIDFTQGAINTAARLGSKVSGIKSPKVNLQGIKPLYFSNYTEPTTGNQKFARGAGKIAFDVGLNQAVAGGIKPAIKPFQMVLGNKAGKLIGGKLTSKVAGKGLANLSQGLPYSGASAIQSAAEGRPVGKEFVGNLAFDALTGPLISKGSKATKTIGKELTDPANVKALIRDEAGTFAGKNAVSLRGLEGKKLEEAMLRKGAFSNTLDKGVRFPVSDYSAKLKPNALKDAESLGFSSLGDILEHKALYKEYPHLQNIPVRFDPNIKGAGFFNSNSGSMTINPKIITKEKILSVLHENTHAIQNLEGFAKGGRIGDKDYPRLLGEIEATAAERSANLPLKELKGRDLIAEETFRRGLTPSEVVVRGQSPVSFRERGLVTPLDELNKISEYGMDGKIDIYGTGNYKPKANNIEIKADAESVARGEALSAINAKEVGDSFATWVNSRRASNVEGLLKSKEFADLDAKGINGVLEFQAGDKTGRFKDLKGYFDNKYKELQKEGIEFNYKEDYLTQIWRNPPEEVEKVFRSLGTRPSFTKEAIFKNYQEGINAGLTPKFEKVSDIVRVYEQSTQKAIADHRYFKQLADEGMILPANKAPREWVTVNPDRFPKINSSIGDKAYSGNYKAPTEIAEKINNYLGDANFKWLEKVADWTSATKNRLLSFGVPKTALNAHGFNILSRNVLSSKNPLEGAYTGVKYMLNPSLAQKYLDIELSKAPAAIKNGLTLSTSEFKGALDMPQDFRGEFGEKWGNLFEVALFDKMLPALKLQKYQEVYEGFLKSGMPEVEAGRNAAKFTNDVFGGINWEELGQSRDMQNLLRSTILAPDWARTNINLAINLPKSVIRFSDPTLAPYRRFLATFLGAYVTMNVVNKLSSGHWAFENDTGNQFNIEAGYTEDGQKRYIRPFGTGADFARLPVDVLSALKRGDLSTIPRLVRNRLSVPLGVGIGAMTDTDYRGQPIGYRGTDKYGNDIPTKQRVSGIGGELATLAGVPAFTKQVADYASGKTGGEQALLQAFELPVRYSGGTRSNIAKQAQEIEQLSGKALYDRNKSLAGQTKLSDNQLATVKSGNTSIQDILAGREKNRADEEIKEQLRSEGTGIKESPDKVFYYEDGQVKSVEKDRKLPELELTGNAELDKKAKSKYSSAITAKANDIYKMYELGILSANEAEKQLDALTQAKSKTSSGKAKKSKGVRVSAPKVQAVKVALSTPVVSKAKKLILKSPPKAKIKLKKPESIKLDTKTYANAKPAKFRNTLDTSIKLV